MGLAVNDSGGVVVKVGQLSFFARRDLGSDAATFLLSLEKRIEMNFGGCKATR